MLELAIKAGLPLVKVTTDDVLNYRDVLAHYLDNNVIYIEGLAHLGDKKYSVLYAPSKINYKQAYMTMMESDCTLIVVNPSVDDPLMFDAGPLSVPKEMIREELATGGLKPRLIENLIPVFSGMSLLKIGEICQLTSAQYGEITPQGAASIKMQLIDTGGLVGVNPTTNFYLPNKELTNFAQAEGYFFTEYENDSFAPRGLLLHGMAGTGKSQAAKYLARMWEVPLYMMDMSLIMNKYVGESENKMRTTLMKVDAEAPCILLLDEVEKVFAGDSDKGTTTRLMGQLLWWMQEHRSRVFLVMTSNNIKGLPPELYREGRVDKVLEFGGLKSLETIRVFAQQAFEVYSPDYDAKFPLDALHSKYVMVGTEGFISQVSHAEIVAFIKRSIKEQILQGKEKAHDN